VIRLRVLAPCLLASATAISRLAVAADSPVAPLWEWWTDAGIEYYKVMNYECARKAFVEAHAAHDNAATTLRLALAELFSGHAQDAAEDFRRFLRAPGADERKRQIVREKFLPQSEQRVAHLNVEGPVGFEIVVDGGGQGIAPRQERVDVLPGAHEVLVRACGWSELRHVDVEADEVVTVHFEDPRIPPCTDVAVGGVAQIASPT
jgi:tetratricopeptide (TPR) repeat protein